MNWLKKELRSLLVIGPAFVIFAPIIYLASYFAQGSVPLVKELTEITGVVESVKTNKSNQLIKLDTNGEVLTLSSSCKCHKNLVNKKTSILVEPDALGRDLYFIWQIETEAGIFYSYEQRKSEYFAKNVRGMQIGRWGTFIGILLMPVWWRFRIKV